MLYLDYFLIFPECQFEFDELRKGSNKINANGSNFGEDIEYKDGLSDSKLFLLQEIDCHNGRSMLKPISRSLEGLFVIKQQVMLISFDKEQYF